MTSAKVETCYLCEPREDLHNWKRPDVLCSACKAIAVVDEIKRPLYTPGEVRAVLRQMVDWRERGLEKGSQVFGLIRVADIWDAVKFLESCHRITPVELNAVSARLGQGWSGKRLAIALGVSEAAVSKAIKSAGRKIAVVLNSEKLENLSENP